MNSPRFFYIIGAELQIHDTEDKRWWLDHCAVLEDAFLDICREKKILRGISPNPLRRASTAYLPEFIWSDAPLDVKVQTQPFFESELLFGIPPRYAITLNRQDFDDVSNKYPDCRIAIWIRWHAVRYLREKPSGSGVGRCWYRPPPWNLARRPAGSQPPRARIPRWFSLPFVRAPESGYPRKRSRQLRSGYPKTDYALA
jgi:hypothetical protein